MKKTPDKKSVDKDIIIDMPEVKDIPGQEHIKPPRMGEMLDSTPSSADEEGEGLLDDLNKDDEELLDDDDELLDEDSNVSAEEKELLQKASVTTDQDLQNLSDSALESTDDEDALNENSNPLDMGKDLDVPGSEDDDDDEEIGEEDEENNSYSRKD